jgi:hypothetical protein
MLWPPAIDKVSFKPPGTLHVHIGGSALGNDIPRELLLGWQRRCHIDLYLTRHPVTLESRHEILLTLLIRYSSPWRSPSGEDRSTAISFACALRFPLRRSIDTVRSGSCRGRSLVMYRRSPSTSVRRTTLPSSNQGTFMQGIWPYRSNTDDLRFLGYSLHRPDPYSEGSTRI